MEGIELLDQSIRRAKFARNAPVVVQRITPFADKFADLADKMAGLEKIIAAQSSRLNTLESVNDNLAARIKFLDGMLRAPLDLEAPPPSKIIGPSIEHIISQTAFHFGVMVDEIKGQRRHTAIVLPRGVAMYLCRKLTFKTMPAIGLHFEGRDHTTVLHAVKKITARRAIDGVLNEALTAIERAIKQPRLVGAE